MKQAEADETLFLNEVDCVLCEVWIKAKKDNSVNLSYVLTGVIDFVVVYGNTYSSF